MAPGPGKRIPHAQIERTRRQHRFDRQKLPDWSQNALPQNASIRIAQNGLQAAICIERRLIRELYPSAKGSLAEVNFAHLVRSLLTRGIRTNYSMCSRGR